MDHPGALQVVCAWSDADFIATLDGAFVGDAATHFGEILVLESWRALDRIALDLSGVATIDLRGLTALWQVAEGARAFGGVLEIQSAPPAVHQCMQAFGLTDRVVTGPAGEVRDLLDAADSEPGF